MKLKIDIEVVPSSKKITHQSKCIFIGSCFSDDISMKFQEGGLNILTNPFGTLFHPLAILNLFEDLDIDSTCFQRDDVWLSWLASSVIFGLSKDELVFKLNSLKKELHDYLKESDFLFLTLGTAIGYRLKSTNQLVANCHKMPMSLFFKELTDATEMTNYWLKLIEKIKSINPSLEIVFTVSPVRHIKEGVIENNISKSQLFSLIYLLKENYFPSYEIVNDELRDYRFFKEDLVHPNQQAIDYVWEKFRVSYMDIKTNVLIDEVMSIRKMIHHRTLHPNSAESIRFQEKIMKKKKGVNMILPSIKW